MATLVTLRANDPQNVLDAYGANAVFRLERDTSAAMTTASEVATVAVVAGTTEYEYQDQTGVSGTHFYRSRFSRASPSVATDYSAYSQVFQAGTEAGYTNLERVRTRMGIAASSTADDGYLALLVGAVNARLLRETQHFIGPSAVTSRVFDGRDAVDGKLYIPGGIRTATAITVAAATGDAQTAAATTDWRLGPVNTRPGQPYLYVEFFDVVAGSWSYWPSAYRNITITGTFGYDAVPDDISELADMLVVKMFQTRQSGQRDIIGSDEMGNALVSRFLSIDDKNLLRSYRLEHASFAYV